MKLLAAREHSQAELLRKLAPYADNEDDVRRAIAELAERGFVDDARVAASVVRQRAERQGGRRIRQELQAKGLDDSLVDAALADLASSEHERAWALWVKRFHREVHEPADDQPLPDLHANQRPSIEDRAAAAKDTARQARFLLSRGFSSEVVHATLRKAAQFSPRV